MVDGAVLSWVTDILILRSVSLMKVSDSEIKFFSNWLNSLFGIVRRLLSVFGLNLIRWSIDCLSEWESNLKSQSDSVVCLSQSDSVVYWLFVLMRIKFKTNQIYYIKKKNFSGIVRRLRGSDGSSYAGLYRGRRECVIELINCVGFWCDDAPRRLCGSDGSSYAGLYRGRRECVIELINCVTNLS